MTPQGFLGQETVIQRRHNFHYLALAVRVTRLPM